MNANGQLGVGDEEDRSVPTRVLFQEGGEILLVSSGSDNSLALKRGGASAEPTNSPSAAAGTAVPTYAPTPGGTAAPTEDGLTFWFWGGPEAVGQESTVDVTAPIDVGGDVVHSSAGSKYSIIVLENGQALAAGYVNDLDEYTGHLGVDPESVKQGVNPFKPVLKVYDPRAGAASKLVDAPRFRQVFAGVEDAPDTGVMHTVFLDDDGRAWAAGSNGKGQLCLGDDVDRDIPELIDAGPRIVGVAVGAEFTLLLDEDGDVHGCGSNAMGQIGLGVTVADTNAPTRVRSLSGVRMISSGHSHSVYLTEEGVYVSGSNQFGQLCSDSNGDDRIVPTKLQIDGKVATSIGTIRTSSYLLYEDGSVNSCGSNEFGQLGDGSNVDQFITVVDTSGQVVRLLGVGPSSESVFFVTIPSSAPSPPASLPAATPEPSASDAATPEPTAVTSFVDTFVDTFTDTPGEDTDISNLFPDSRGNKRIYRKKSSLSARRLQSSSEEKVWGTGLNDRGQLGVGDKENRDLPTRVLFEEVVNLELLTVSEVHSIALGTSSGTFSPTEAPGTYMPTAMPTTSATTQAPTQTGLQLFFMGAPESAGQEFETDVILPYDLGDGVANVGAGSQYSIIVLPDGSALATGFVPSLNDYQGHLGINPENVVEGTNELQLISSVTNADGQAEDPPRFLHAFAGVEQSPDSGIVHSVLIDSSGQAWAFGSNSAGQLCLGDSVARADIPERITLPGQDFQRVVDVAIGAEHTWLLTENGDVFACGTNEGGEIGLGETVRSASEPTQVEGFDGTVTTISSGHSHSLFTTTEGIYFTGSNEFGQLCGDTDDENVFVPQELSIEQRVAIENVVSFDATAYSSYILYADGSVNSCGKNDFGQLADGTNENSLLTTVRSLDGVTRLVGAGPSSQSIFFVTEENTMYAAGLNDRGQLGVGDKDNRNLPTTIGFDQVVVVALISGASDHTLLLGVPSGTYDPTGSPSYNPTVAETPEP